MTCSCCGGDPVFRSRIPKKYSAKCTGSLSDACAACQKLKAIDKKIQDARLVLKGLINEREAMAEVLNENHDPFATTLPVELVSRIFTECWLDAHSWIGSYAIRQALPISQVCKFWRNVAHHTPSLWTRVALSTGTKDLTRKKTMLESWLARSKSLPLFVQIDFARRRLDEPEYLESLRGCITLACHHARRWKSMHYVGDLSDFNLITTTATSFDTLQTVNLSIYGFPVKYPIVLHAAPSFFTINVSPRKWGLQIDLRNLAKFTLKRVGGKEHPIEVACYVDVLQSAPQLKQCKFSQPIEKANSPHSEVVVHPLRELSISSFNNSFWDAFEFPCLTNLDLSIPSTPSKRDEQLSALRRCLVRSDCHIQELRVYGQDPADHDVIELILAMPDLQVLKIEEKLVTPTLFSTLCAMVSSATDLSPRHSQAFLAQLTTFSCCSSFHVAWTVPIQFINTMISRQGRTLETCTLRYWFGYNLEELPEGVDQEVLERLLYLAGKLDLCVSTGNDEDVLQELCELGGVVYPFYEEIA